MFIGRESELKALLADLSDSVRFLHYDHEGIIDGR